MWQINYSKQAFKFIQKQKDLEANIKLSIKKCILRLQGEDLNIDIKKMKGKWIDYIRIREGKLRIILKIDFDSHSVFVDKIDFRGDVYK